GLHLCMRDPFEEATQKMFFPFSPSPRSALVWRPASRGTVPRCHHPELATTTGHLQAQPNYPVFFWLEMGMGRSTISLPMQRLPRPVHQRRGDAVLAMRTA